MKRNMPNGPVETMSSHLFIRFLVSTGGNYLVLMMVVAVDGTQRVRKEAASRSKERLS